MTRCNPYGEALTLEEWRAAQAVTDRPLTWPWRRSPTVLADARHSRIVQPRPRTPRPAEETAA